VSLLTTAQVLGQSQPDPLPASFLPVSPTVSAFQRFDKQSLVNLITGAAQTSIPVAELRSGPLQTAVSLNYSFSGLKVVQPPDLVGLGWSLQAGGSISRRVVGRLDESPDGYGPYNSATVSDNGSDHDFLEGAMEGHADTAPDVYDFSVGPYQGRFVLRDTTVILLPQQPLQIRKLSNNRGFQMCAETGVRYLFETVAAETTTPHHDNFGSMPAYLSAWHVTRIISAGNTDTLRFYYSAWDYQERLRIGQTTLRALEYIGNSRRTYLDQPARNSWVRGSVIHTKLLDSVTTRGARILVRRNSEHVVQRVLLVSTVARKRRVVRSTELGHSRFATLPFLPAAEGRLRLDWVQEGNGALRLPPHRFSYDTANALPPTTSTGQDHWGYYNGADNNGANGVGSALLPHPRLEGLSANRTPNWPLAAAGALRRITYPTGGTTAITYEPNRYEVSQKFRTAMTRYDAVANTTSPHGLAGALLQPTSTPSYARFPCVPVSFTLNEAKQVTFVLEAKPLYPSEEYNNRTYDFLLVRNDSVLVAKKGTPGEEFSWNEQLRAGSYTGWVICEPDGLSSPYVHAEDGNAVTVLVPHLEYVPDVAGNGLRVQQTVTTAIGSPPLTRTYEYTVESPDGAYSSGIMLWPTTNIGGPLYQSRPFQLNKLVQVDLNTYAPFSLYTDYASDITEFGNEYLKYPFFYSRVTETAGPPAGQRAGKTVHCFRAESGQFGDVLPSKVETYRGSSESNDLQVVQTERYRSVVDTTQAPVFAAVRPYIWATSEEPGTAADVTRLYRADYARVFAYFVAPASTRTARYGPQGDSLVTETHTAYSQRRPVRSTQRDSHGNQRISAVKYLSDYAPTLRGYAQLRARNFNPVVEAQQWLRRPGQVDSVLIGGSVSSYNPTWQRPDSTWRLEVATPQPGPNAQVLTNGQYRSYRSDTRYRFVATERYSAAAGDPIGQWVASGPSTAYVWGYQRTAVVAAVENATPEQVAYTGFEAGELGRWQGLPSAVAAPGYTGANGYNLAAGLSCTGLPAGTYRISCRQQATSPSTANGIALQPVGAVLGGWQEYTAVLSIGNSGTVHLTGSGQLDEVRLCPIGARLTSYTHEPLVGETSQMDPSGRTTFYEYDALGRLVRARDEQGRILSQQQYHYARP